MKNEELIMNNEKYNAVGAGLVPAQRNSEKPNANNVGAACHTARKIKTQKGITLIALIITIIILLILAGVTISVVLGPNGLFSTTKNAGEEYTKAGLKEELETEILSIQSKKMLEGKDFKRDDLNELSSIGAMIYSVEVPAEGEYKDYEFTIDANYNVTIGRYIGNLPKLVSKITLNHETSKTVLLTPLELKVTKIEPKNATNKLVNWSSSDTNVLTVSDTGVVTPVSVGSAVITCASVDGGASTTCKVEVVDGTLIYSRADLEAIPSGDANRGKTYILMNDIDLAGENWTPLGDFYGTFDGNGHIIKNMTSVHTSGFFGWLKKSAIIKNVYFKDASVTSPATEINNTSDVGIIGNGCEENTIVECCAASGTVIGGQSNTVGALFGRLGGGRSGSISITNCYVNVTISGGYKVGGLAGSGHSAHVLFNNCYFSGISNVSSRLFSAFEGYECSHTINSCYYNKTLYGGEKKSDATGLTTEQFADKNNFEGWDFENTWIIKDGYPELRMFLRD